jgi:hypothetical protein
MTALHVPQTVIGSISVKSKNQGISFRVNGKSTSCSTGELSKEDKVAFMDLQDTVCDMLISPIDEEMPVIKEVKSEVDKKPPSQRMRGVLYVLWEQNPEGYKVFNTYYENKMEAIIEHLKGKIQ